MFKPTNTAQYSITYCTEEYGMYQLRYKDIESNYRRVCNHQFGTYTLEHYFNILYFIKPNIIHIIYIRTINTYWYYYHCVYNIRVPIQYIISNNNTNT